MKGHRELLRLRSDALHRREVPWKIRRATPPTWPLVQKQIPEMKLFHPHDGTSPSSRGHGAGIRMSPPLLYMQAHIEIISLI